VSLDDDTLQRAERAGKEDQTRTTGRRSPSPWPGGSSRWLAHPHAWLQVEYLPAYAPDLNPVEGLWANLKGVELANRACGSLEELAAAAERASGGCGASSSCCLGSCTRKGVPCECHAISRGSVAHDGTNARTHRSRPPCGTRRRR
jgi:hypothetical protein